MLYQMYEFNHAVIAPLRALATAGLEFWQSAGNPLAETYVGRSATASLKMFERVTRRYAKPGFDIPEVEIDGRKVAVREEVQLTRPFCHLLHFVKDLPAGQTPGKKVLLVAPMSGHYATLLRDTVQSMLPYYDIYITDWIDARTVPLSAGTFDLDDYIDYIIDILRHLGDTASVMAVCQPSVPVLAAVSVMNEHNDPATPRSQILIGGPIDTRRNPTAVNKLAKEKGIDWFRQNVIMRVPFPHAGVMREVYPGFLQLTGFMTMNMDRHVDAHRELFWHMVEGDGDSAEKHEDFYDEYMSVMDLAAEFYLQTVDYVFIKHALPAGTFRHRGELITPQHITKTALMTIEGERDDISGQGQTQAAHDLCAALPDAKRVHWLQPGVGHYGVFSGSRFRREVLPRIRDFIDTQSA